MIATLTRLVLLWLPFSLACLAAIVLSLALLLCGSKKAGKLLAAMDRVLAAFFWSGRYTVSAECAVSHHHAAKVLRRFLDWIEPGHCEKAAREEGLLFG